MKLIHLMSHESNNIGNAALSSGTRRVLREDLGGQVTFALEPWDEYNWAGTRRYADLVAMLNADYDGMVVGAASIFDGATRYRDAGFRFNLPFALWDEIKKPVLFYGVGYGAFPRQVYHNRAALRRTILRMMDHPHLMVAVRNDDAKPWLERTVGRPLPRVGVVPDPALYVETSPAAHLELDRTRLNVVLSLNAEHPSYRFGGRWPQRVWRYVPDWRLRKSRFLRGLVRAIERLGRERPVNLILVPHTPYDCTMMGEFVALCSPKFATYHIVTSGVLRGLEGGRHHYDLYRHADVVLSMRVHSQVCGVGLGVPTISLASLPRMHAFMADVGLRDFAVDVLDPAIEERVSELLNACVTDPALKARFASIPVGLRDRSRVFNRQVRAFLGTDG